MPPRLSSRLRVLLLSLVIPTLSYADVTLPKLVSDGMVLQQNVTINIWGWADKSEKITIKFNRKVYHATAGNDGTWKVGVDAMKPGGPYTMNISGKNAITIMDILVGDVWLCSGQSNMVLTMERVKEKYPEEIKGANYPEIRNFFIPTTSDVTGPHKDFPQSKWISLTPENVLGFGAVTYFFAKSIYQKYHVPIGIINSSVGGTPIEAWISEAGLKRFPALASMIQNFKDSMYMNRIRKPVVQTERPNSGIDLGMSGPKPWYDTAYVPKGWHDFWLPGYWEDQGVKGLIGIVWFRKEISVPASMAKKPAKLFMGRIVDADNLYVNGELSGSVTYQYPPRRYTLRSGLLKAGKNVLVIKVTNTNGKGGFVPDKPYFILVGNEKIDLRGDWKYKVGQVFDRRENRSGPAPFSAQNSPTGLYNTMIAPAIPYSIKGITWYQGESNTGRPEGYDQLLIALASDWRDKWKQGSVPFLFVQLANFMEVQYSPSESQWAELRNLQRKALAMPNAAMVVTIDAGEWNDIHPLNKKDVGERLALAAESVGYNDKTVVYSGPLYRSHLVDGNKIIVSFDHTGGGLIAKGDEALQFFTIAGEDRKFVWAKTRIEGDKVIVWNEGIANPRFVRYAWADNPEGANLYNKEGLPASPFETENK